MLILEGSGLASFLIIVALVVGMVDCGKLAPSYIHTVASTAGGSVPTPDQGTFIYDGATVVDFVASLDAGHRFVNWTGDVSTTVMSTSPRRASP